MRLKIDKVDAILLGKIMDTLTIKLMVKMGCRYLLVANEYKKTIIKLKYTESKVSITLSYHKAQMLHELFSIMPDFVYAQLAYIHLDIQKYVADALKKLENQALSIQDK